MPEIPAAGLFSFLSGKGEAIVIEKLLDALSLTGKNKFRNICVVLLGLFLLVPSFPLRILIICILVIFIKDSILEIKKEYLFCVLFVCYCLTFLYPGFWGFFKTPFLKVSCFVFLYIFGVFWAYRSTDTLRVNFSFRIIYPYFILTGLMFIVHYNPMHADISWRGDEDLHFLEITHLAEYLYEYSIVFLSRVFERKTLGVFILSFLCFLLLRRKLKGGRLIGVLIFSVVCLGPVCISVIHPCSPEFLQRSIQYPWLSRWIGLFFTWGAVFDSEAFYRMLPFMSSIFLTWFLYTRFMMKLQNSILSLISAFTIATVPSLYYYSSVVYLSIPEVVLMIVCLFDIDALLHMPFDKLVKRPSWYCLILTYFFKETALISIIIIFIIRFIIQMGMFSSVRDRIKVVMSEARIAILLTGPFLAWFVLRLYFWVPDETYGGISNITRMFNPYNYSVVFTALCNQYGLLFIAALIGMIVMYLKKDRKTAIVMFSLLFGIFFVFTCFKNYIYLGTSRWYLQAAPCIVVSSVYLISSIRNRYFCAGVLGLIFMFNVILLPIYPEGVRIPNWGSPTADATDYTYPYRDAIKWLSQEDLEDDLLVTGHYYIYNGLYFYLNKYYRAQRRILRTKNFYFGDEKFDEAEEFKRLRRFFIEYDRRHKTHPPVETILYHSVNNLDLGKNIAGNSGFDIIKKISNRKHSLYVFRRYNPE